MRQSHGIIAAACAGVLGFSPVILAQGDDMEGKKQETKTEYQDKSKDTEKSDQSSKLEQQDAQAQQQAQQGDAQKLKPIASTVRGTIENIDLDKGELQVKPAEGEEMTLKARPYDLEKLEENQQASLRVLDFQGEKWLAPEKGATAQALEKRGWAQQIAVGPIENVDMKTGEVKLEGESYKVHPQEAQNLQPGQFVSLSFSEFGDNQWVAGVKTGAEAQKEASQEARRSSQMNQQSPQQGIPASDQQGSEPGSMGQQQGTQTP